MGGCCCSLVDENMGPTPSQTELWGIVASTRLQKGQVICKKRKGYNETNIMSRGFVYITSDFRLGVFLQPNCCEQVQFTRWEIRCSHIDTVKVTHQWKDGMEMDEVSPCSCCCPRPGFQYLDIRGIAESALPPHINKWEGKVVHAGLVIENADWWANEIRRARDEHRQVLNGNPPPAAGVATASYPAHGQPVVAQPVVAQPVVAQPVVAHPVQPSYPAAQPSYPAAQPSYPAAQPAPSAPPAFHEPPPAYSPVDPKKHT